MAEVVGDAALLVAPASADALTAALARVLDDTELAGRLREAGPVQAAPFTWAASVEHHLDAYRLATGVPA
jgi:glycosyltransferase involved in cell wall biosynthesis